VSSYEHKYKTEILKDLIIRARNPEIHEKTKGDKVSSNNPWTLFSFAENPRGGESHLTRARLLQQQKTAVSQ
jgi:hypothetical protein